MHTCFVLCALLLLFVMVHGSFEDDQADDTKEMYIIIAVVCGVVVSCVHFEIIFEFWKH